ncbi:MAG: methyltransferase domain-containing protein [Phycisphaeraceae bacterium]|nr:methyltransferase domain-containing protein [Phycisphaeraceae bacterium]
MTTSTKPPSHHAAAHPKSTKPGAKPRGGKRRFLAEFLRRPNVVGAIAPSSTRLAKRMVSGLDLKNASAVVEFGPGTGVFTRQILDSIGPHTRFFAVERQPELAEVVRSRCPAANVIVEDAAHIEKICKALGVGDAAGRGGVDYILSGLPWTVFSDSLRTTILEAAHRALRPGGQLVTFAYHLTPLVPGGRHFRREVRRLFARVDISEVVWANVPPAFVYRCTR